MIVQNHILLPGASLRLRPGVGVGQILPTPAPTPTLAKTVHSDPLQLRSRLPLCSPGLEDLEHRSLACWTAASAANRLAKAFSDISRAKNSSISSLLVAGTGAILPFRHPLVLPTRRPGR